MPQEHPDPHLLERFMRGELQGQSRRTVVRHLLTGCSPCVAVTRRLWSLGEERLVPPGGKAMPAGGRGRSRDSEYRQVFERLARRAAETGRRLAVERRESPRLLEELLAQPRPRRLALICADRRFQGPALCELLLERCRRADPPALAEEMAEAAVAIAGQIDGRLCGATVARSLRARSWAHLGDARRLAGDLAGAEEALAAAEPLVDEVGDPLEIAELHGFKACLLGEQGKLAEAVGLLDKALALYRTAGDRHLLGRTLVQKGTIRSWAREIEETAAPEAIRLLREGLGLLDHGADPRLAAGGLLRLGLLLAEAGRGEEALAAARQARPLYDELGDVPNLLRLRRLEGKAEEALGRLDAAEAALREACQGFLREGLGVETAGVMLELAVLYKQSGRSPELDRLAGEISPVFRTPDIRRHVAAALLVFRRIVETGHANLVFLREIARFLAGPPRTRRPALRWV
jgi:tetratricopeptide (TPR) repeat protein